MGSVGWLEMLVLGVIAVMVFGPERLPRLIAQAAQWMRVVRAQATSARDDLVAAADLDPAMTSELRRSVSELAELHPRKLASSLIADVSAPFNDAAGSARRAASDQPATGTGTPSPGTPEPPAYDTDAT
jgi:sec-independent protein translocase protein TatB